MSKRQTSLTSAFVVVSALLAVNLIVFGARHSEAQIPATAGPAGPVMVHGFYTTDRLWRFFSDGMVDMTNIAFGTPPGHCSPIAPGWCDPEDVGPHVILPPAAPLGSPGPTVIAGQYQDLRLFRFWSDGSVDVTSIEPHGSGNGCVPVPFCPDPGPFQVIGPAPYTACAPFDSSLDGFVDVVDLLDLLAAWGCSSGL